MPRSLRITRRSAATVSGCVAVVGFVFADPAAAATSVRDDASWGWGSVPAIRWSYADSFWATIENPSVNDSVQDGYVVRMYVRAHDYDGTQRGPALVYDDFSHDGQPVVGQPHTFDAYPNTIDAISIQICRARWSGVDSCRPRQYAYR